MTTQETDQMCGNLVRKMTAGESLDDAEKAHLAVGEDCMARVLKALDESATSDPHGNGVVSAGTNGDLTRARPEAKKALEHGRSVFAREFGIALPKE